MLDRLLVSLGSAALGGALVYFMWSLATRRLAQHRVRRAARHESQSADDQVRESAPPVPDAELPSTTDGLAEIQDSLAELARAQVSIIERLEQPAEDRREGEDVADQVAARLVALSAKLDTLAERPAPEAAVAEGMGALDGRLAAIEDLLSTHEPAEEDSADHEAAMAEAMEALANRLESVETGLSTVLARVEAGQSPDSEAQAEALRTALEAVLPSDTLPALEAHLGEKIDALSERVASALTAGVDSSAELAERLDAILSQLAAAAEHRDGAHETLGILSECLGALLDQLEQPAELAFSEEALSELHERLQDALSASDGDAEQSAALFEALAALDTRLDAMQTRLDTLASDRSPARTLEIIGAISTLQTDTARLKGGIEHGFAQISEVTGETAERIAALAGRIADLETGIGWFGGASGSGEVSPLTRSLEDLAQAELPATTSEALQAERESLAAMTAELIAARLASSAAAQGPELAQTSRTGPDPDRQTGPSTADLKPVPDQSQATLGKHREETESTSAAAPTLVPDAVFPDEAGANAPRPAMPGPVGPAAYSLGDAEITRAESSDFRARRGIATLVGRQASQKSNGGDG